MCGIAGLVAANARQYDNSLSRMIDTLKHRGPDSSGSCYFSNCGLAHTRLCIIDLFGGTQPMLAAEGQIGITFNGEIYGYRDLKKENLADYDFRNTSDTEVILALYLKYGTDMIQHLPGMFAFAIWDDRNQELFCARDRFGEKPFYYAFGECGEFIFASEIKAILATELVRPRLSRKSLAHYLRKRYVHPHTTIYQNIYTLPPAHSIWYRKGKLQIEKYWHLPERRTNLSLSDATEEFSSLFTQAVKKQLVADVPVGAFLSGGLDSTSVVTVAASICNRLKTYSFGFNGDLNELPYARSVARKYETNHMELIDEKHDLADLLIRMQNIYDEPFGDSSNIPTYLISSLASKHGKVVLTGDGGDELLGGYSYWYRVLYQMEREIAPSPWKMFLFSFLARIGYRMRLKQLETYCSNKSTALHYLAKYGSVINAHQTQNVWFDDSELRSFGFADSEISNSSSWDWVPKGTVDDAFRMDLLDYMPGDVLVKTDRASMAHGLELRSPFLDVDVASFCISLPPELKINNRKDKVILREGFSKEWPEIIRKRSKQGFVAPISEWLKCDSIYSLKHDYLTNPRRKLFDLISYEACQPYVDQNSFQTWTLLMLALWAETHSFEMSNSTEKKKS